MAIIRIPDLIGAVNHFRTAIYPDYKGVLQAAEQWFASYNIMSSTRSKAYLNALMPGLQGALVYPLSDKKSLRFAIDQFILFFVYDDPFDEEALRLDEGTATKFTNAIVSVITDIESFQPIPKFPVITAYHDFFVRLRAESTASAYERFVDETVESILSPCLTMIKITRRIDVPDYVVQHPTIQALRDIANDLVCFANDIFSFNREQAKGDYFNLVSILCIEKKIPVQSAIEYVFVMFESAIRRWYDLRAQIPKFDPHTDETVSKLVEGLEYSISGFVHWHWDTERYLGPQERRGEVKNALIKVYPLELGSPQMPADIKYGYNLNIEF